MTFSDDIDQIVQFFRRGDMLSTRRAAEGALKSHSSSLQLLELAGVAAARLGDTEAAEEYFRRGLALDPHNETFRINLMTALVERGALEEAANLGNRERAGPRLLRLLAYVHQQLGDLPVAAKAYEELVGADPGDFASWNNLGNVRAAQGMVDKAIEALQRAIVLRPDQIPIYLNLSDLLARADRFNARVELMREAARRAPNDAAVLVELGLAEAGARDLDAAERALRNALKIEPNSLSAYIELAMLLENLNKVEALAQLAEDATANGLSEPETNFIRAWAMRRQGRIEEALALAEQTPLTISPVRRYQLLGDLYDRTGDVDRAFQSFTSMNEAAAAERAEPGGRTYLEIVRTAADRITSDWTSSWTGRTGKNEALSPIFVVGFPRSGTTLLDTLLMNMPQLHVLEELPVLRKVELALRSEHELPVLDEDEVQRLRNAYFEALEEISPPAAGQIVVDKFPLHLTQMPLIHRLFPDAKVIMVERHPCDAVLSCFMANFQLNLGMRSFVNLERAAEVYDAAFQAWTRAIDLLPINMHCIRYERMVSDLEGEMRPLLGFLELPWDQHVLDNRASASNRSHIRTASYSQVTEPIYQRAAYRWERYRAHLSPILPILKPWAEKMGYEI